MKKGNNIVKLPAGKLGLAGRKPGVMKGHELRAMAAINVFENQLDITHAVGKLIPAR